MTSRMTNDRERRKMPADTSQIDHGNGADVPPTAPYLGQLDRRTRRALVYQDLLDAYLADRGGLEMASNGEVGLCEELAGLRTLLKEYRTDYLAGRPVDKQEWAVFLNIYRRYQATLGIGRVARNITPHLHDYIRQRDDAA